MKTIAKRFVNKQKSHEEGLQNLNLVDEVLKADREKILKSYKSVVSGIKSYFGFETFKKI